jgi:hypothetical protein
MTLDKPNAEEIVRGFAHVARPIMREFMEAASCIASARTTIEVMRRYELRTSEIPVSLCFQVNAKKYARIAGFSKAERARMQRTARNWRDDIPDGGGWNGHLLVLVENRWLLDPSIDQAESAEFQVPVPPKVLVIDLKGQEGFRPSGNFVMRLGFRLDNGDEGKLDYRRIRDRSYLDTEAWNDDGLPLLAGVIANQMGVRP